MSTSECAQYKRGIEREVNACAQTAVDRRCRPRAVHMVGGELVSRECVVEESLRLAISLFSRGAPRILIFPWRCSSS